MGGSYLGPEYTDTEIRAYLESQGCVFSVKKEYEIFFPVKAKQKPIKLKT